MCKKPKETMGHIPTGHIETKLKEGHQCSSNATYQKPIHQPKKSTFPSQSPHLLQMPLCQSQSISHTECVYCISARLPQTLPKHGIWLFSPFQKSEKPCSISYDYPKVLLKLQLV